MITDRNIYTSVEVECDCCGYIGKLEPEQGRFDTPYTATEIFREMGWSIGKKNICRTCRENGCEQE